MQFHHFAPPLVASPAAKWICTHAFLAESLFLFIAMHLRTVRPAFFPPRVWFLCFQNISLRFELFVVFSLFLMFLLLLELIANRAPVTIWNANKSFYFIYFFRAFFSPKIAGTTIYWVGAFTSIFFLFLLAQMNNIRPHTTFHRQRAYVFFAGFFSCCGIVYSEFSVRKFYLHCP